LVWGMIGFDGCMRFLLLSLVASALCSEFGPECECTVDDGNDCYSNDVWVPICGCVKFFIDEPAFCFVVGGETCSVAVNSDQDERIDKGAAILPCLLPPLPPLPPTAPPPVLQPPLPPLQPGEPLTATLAAQPHAQPEAPHARGRRRRRSCREGAACPSTALRSPAPFPRRLPLHERLHREGVSQGVREQRLRQHRGHLQRDAAARLRARRVLRRRQ
jgi:hypothetical protein